jgi:DNA-binding XRE family transcriptional regulator
MALKDKREWAELLYSRTMMTQKEIAERVEVSEHTLGKWKEQFNWDQLRTSFYITKGQQLSRIYQQIAALNNSISERPDGERFANTREADIVCKLAGAAKTLESETSISDIVDVFIEFTDWLRENDFNRAREISELMDAFIKHKLIK